MVVYVESVVDKLLFGGAFPLPQARTLAIPALLSI